MNRIRELRELHGWNQDDLGKRLNVKRAAVSKYENEKIPLTAETILKLSEIFNVSSDYILGRMSVAELDDGLDIIIIEMSRALSLPPEVIRESFSKKFPEDDEVYAAVKNSFAFIIGNRLRANRNGSPFTEDEKEQLKKLMSLSREQVPELLAFVEFLNSKQKP